MIVGMLRRAFDAAQRFQRFVQIPDRVVELVGEIVRGADRVQQPESVFRRQHLLRFGMQRQQPLARGERRALDDGEPRGADFGEQLTAAIAGVGKAPLARRATGCRARAAAP